MERCIPGKSAMRIGSRRCGGRCATGRLRQCGPFVTEDPRFLEVMAAAKLYSQRPSALMAIDDPVLALAVDLAATRRHHRILADENDGPVEREEW